MIQHKKKSGSSQGTLSISNGKRTPKKNINTDDADAILALVGEIGITDTSQETNELLFEANSNSSRSRRVTVTESHKTESNSHQQMFE